jgi:RNA polymerase sigma-70 factor, ECF subfamily
MHDPAFERLIQDHGGMVRAVARSRCGNPHDTDEVVQETFLRAFRSFGGFRGASRVRTWLYVLARNVAIDHLRRRNRRAMLALSEEIAAPRRRGESVDEAMGRLPRECRRIFAMSVVGGMTQRSIARVLSLSRGATRKALLQAFRTVHRGEDL